VSLSKPPLDVPLTYAQVVKRIQQLTGHIIPSAKLPAISTVKSLLAILVRPPKPKKLVEELQANGELEALSNVTVHDRRVTPIDKQKAVGRWKVIVQELEKRDLPVTGTGDYDKNVETKWLWLRETALKKERDEKRRAKKREKRM
jgi:Rap1 GTPase-GDP dissociation stimulator 1